MAEQPQNHIHKMVFEMLDKEMRKVSLDRIKNVVILNDLSKDIYPVNMEINRLLKKFSLPNHFYYNNKNQWEVHFIKSRDQGKLILSVITLKLLPVNTPAETELDSEEPDPNTGSSK